MVVHRACSEVSPVRKESLTGEGSDRAAKITGAEANEARQFVACHPAISEDFDELSQGEEGKVHPCPGLAFRLLLLKSEDQGPKGDLNPSSGRASRLVMGFKDGLKEYPDQLIGKGKPPSKRNLPIGKEIFLVWG